MLAVGSGSVFTSAAFNNRVNPSSDMRVVVDDSLLVEPGISFRTGSNPGDSYDSNLDPTSGKFAGDNNGNIFDVTNPSTDGSDELSSNIDVADLPVAFVSNDTNGGINIKVAVQLGETATFDDLLQVTNNTGSSVDVGIKFSAFGVDTTLTEDPSSNLTNNGGAVDIENAISAYSFLKSGSSNEISSVGTDDPPTVDGQTIGSALTVSDGNTEQIDLQVDMTSNINAGSDDLVTQANTAASTGSGNPFQKPEDTVQLIQEITVGTNASNET
jgi:hypothetical protein